MAEVLITLGIIGVVAAMTLPSLVGKYKKQQTVAQLQKVYTSLNQALKLSEAKYGPYEYWDEPALGVMVNDYYEKYWYPYFKILKSCKTYSECGYSSIYPWQYLNRTEYTLTFSSGNLRVPFMLTDGTLVSISIAGGSGETWGKQDVVYVDLNGSKLPNTMGIDFFIFQRVKGKGILPYGYSLPSEEVNNSCSSTGKGHYCAAKIISDGWQIKKDYPWK